MTHDLPHASAATRVKNWVKNTRHRNCCVVVFAVLAAAGCGTTITYPQARTPMLTTLQAAPSDSAAFEAVVAESHLGNSVGFPRTDGVFRVYPTSTPNGLPRGVIKVFFTAPSLLALKVDIEGRGLYKFADIPSNLDPQVVGFYRVESVDASDHWQVTIRPPLSPIPRFGLTINIATVSLNPDFATGPKHESAPLVLKLGSKPAAIAVEYPQNRPLPSCNLVPNIPRLRSGLTVTVVDIGKTQMDVGCCHLPSQKVGIGGIIGTVAANPPFPFTGLPEYSMVMQQGGQQHAPGTFTTSQAGRLEICINDDDLANNDGAWGVNIRVDE